MHPPGIVVIATLTNLAIPDEVLSGSHREFTLAARYFQQVRVAVLLLLVITD